jgi:hypothetical protein
MSQPFGRLSSLDGSSCKPPYCLLSWLEPRFLRLYQTIMPAQTTAEMPASPTPTPMPIPAPVDIPELIAVSEERESAASDVATGAAVPGLVWLAWGLLVLSDAVVDVGVDVFEVELLVEKVIEEEEEEDFEEETVGRSSAVMLK